MISAIDDFPGPKKEFLGQQTQDKRGIDHSIFMKWSLSSLSLFTAENDVKRISVLVFTAALDTQFNKSWRGHFKTY